MSTADLAVTAMATVDLASIGAVTWLIGAGRIRVMPAAAKKPEPQPAVQPASVPEIAPRRDVA